MRKHHHHRSNEAPELQGLLATCDHAMRVADRLLRQGVRVRAIHLDGRNPIIACAAGTGHQLRGVVYRYGHDHSGRYACYSAPIDHCEARWTVRGRAAR